MTPRQRALLRRRWQQFRALPAAQRASIRHSFRAFERLPPWRRAMLRKRWRNATPAERHVMIERVQRQMMRRQMMRRIGPRFGPGPGRLGGLPLHRGGRPPFR